MTTLACEACNALMGGTYEPEAVDRLAELRTIAIRFPDMGWITARGSVVDEGGGSVTIRLNDTPSGPRKSSRYSNVFDQMRRRTAEPNEIEMEIRKANDDSVKRALVAWSLLAWSHYARYGYTASEGAHLVRQLVLLPETKLPLSVLVMHGPLWPLGDPDPVLVIRADKEPRTLDDVDEFIGIGVDWGRNSYVLLPFANDATGKCWQRLLELKSSGERATIRRWRIREFLPDGSLQRELRDAMVIAGGGDSFAVTKRPDDVDALARGDSEHRIEPSRGTWTANQSVELRRWVRADDEFRYDHTADSPSPQGRQPGHDDQAGESDTGASLPTAIRGPNHG